MARRQAWSGRSTSGSGSGSLDWAGCGRPATSHRWRAWKIDFASRPFTTRSIAVPSLKLPRSAVRPARGCRHLIERPDVDVIYLLSRQWFGLHPISLACAAGKPVYCALPLADDLAELESLAEASRAKRHCLHARVRPALLPRNLAAQGTLATQLGSPRLIVGHSRLYGFDRYAVPGPTTQIAPAPLLIDPGSYLLDWCCFVFQALPVALHGMHCQVIAAPDPPDQEPDFESFIATFPDAATAQISFGRYHRGAWGDASRFLPQPGFQVFAERGAAWLEMPEKILWSNAAGSKEERLALEPTVGDVLNDQFHRVVRGDHSLAPTIRDALEIARLVSDLRPSYSRQNVTLRLIRPNEEWLFMGMEPNHPRSTGRHDSCGYCCLELAHRTGSTGRSCADC